MNVKCIIVILILLFKNAYCADPIIESLNYLTLSLNNIADTMQNKYPANIVGLRSLQREKSNAIRASIRKALVKEQKLTSKGRLSNAADIEIAINKQLRDDKLLNNVTSSELDNFWDNNSAYINEYLNDIHSKKAEKLKKLTDKLSSLLIQLIDASKAAQKPIVELKDKDEKSENAFIRFFKRIYNDLY